MATDDLSERLLVAVYGEPDEALEVVTSGWRRDFNHAPQMLVRGSSDSSQFAAGRLVPLGITALLRRMLHVMPEPLVRIASRVVGGASSA